MEVDVREGQLTEHQLADGNGIERRAHGEFVGPRGELASYAFGWVSDADPREARLSVGIGSGNLGGGTFNAVIFLRDDGHAFTLVDEPFQSVPQGGPNLSAAEARSHEDLPFVWAVADTVMHRDRRAIWMLHWLEGTLAIATGEVAARQEPALLVVNDDDGMWQLVGSSDPDVATAKVEHLHHHVDGDLTLLDVIDLQPEERAERTHLGSAWIRFVQAADQ